MNYEISGQAVPADMSALMIVAIALLLSRIKPINRLMSRFFSFMASKTSVSIIAYIITGLILYLLYRTFLYVRATESYGFNERISLIDTLLKILTLFIAFLTFLGKDQKDK